MVNDLDEGAYLSEHNAPSLFGGPEGITVEHVNWLLKVCNIVQENPMTTLQQCSSSLFVLMVQRMLGFRVPELHLEPNTFEKKVWNTTRILEELSLVCGENLQESYISPEAIVHGDARHIALLVRVMYHIALHMIRVREDGDRHDANEDAEHPAAHAAPSTATQTSKSSARLVTKAQNEELTSQAPSNDSLAFTKELVTGWGRAVVPPPKRARGALVDPLSVTELQHRIQKLEKEIQQNSGIRRSIPRPSSHDSRAHASLTFLAGRNVERQACVQFQNSFRDAKIEALRNRKFVDNVQQVIKREAVNQRSCAERDCLAAFHSTIAIQRRDRNDAIKQVREGDALLRSAAQALVESERSRLQLRSNLITDDTAKALTSNFAAIRETRKVLKETSSKNCAKLDEEIAVLRQSVGSWRTHLHLATKR